MKKREIHIRESIRLGYMDVTIQGDARELAEILFTSMQHNRVLSSIICSAAAAHFRQNKVDLSQLEKFENVTTFIPPAET